MPQKRYNKLYQAFSIALVLCFLSACASSPKQKTVVKPQNQQTLETVRQGKVTQVSDVMLSGRVTPIGSTTAGVLGRVAGASAGGTSGAAIQILATLGGMVGSILGASAEEKMTRQAGQEIFIQLDNSDETVRVVQALDNQTPFKMGDAVKVIENGSKSRVILSNPPAATE